MLFQSSTGIGVSVQNGVFRAAEIRRLKDGTLSIVRLEELELESGLMEGGHILDIDKLSLFVKDKLFIRGKGWKGKDVWCVLPESLVFFHLFIFPALLGDNEIAQALQIQSEEVFPYAASELVFAHEVIRRTEKSTIVSCAAARYEDISAYENMLQRMGIKAKGCLLPAQALASVFFESIPKGKAYAALYADVDAIAFFWDGFGLRGSLFENVGWGSLYSRLTKEEDLAPQKADALLKKLRTGKGITKVEAGFFDQMIKELAKHVVRGVGWYKDQAETSPIEIVLLSTSFPKAWQESLVEQTTALLPDLRIRFVSGAERFSLKELSKPAPDVSPWAAALGAARLRLQPLPGLLSLSTKDQQTFATTTDKHTQLYVLGIIFTALLLILGFFLWQKNNQKDVSSDAVLEQNTVSNIENTNVSEEPVPVVEEFTTKTFTINTSPSEADLPGRIIESTFDVEILPQIPGVKVDQPAIGKVTLTNETDTTQTFVATTRLLSAEGILFRLKNATTIPSKGQAEAEVYADVAGIGGEIAPTKFTVPGLSADLQTVIYAESAEAMTEGTVEQIVWSSETRQLVEGQIIEKAIANGVQNIQDLLIEGDLFVPLLSSYEVTEITNPPKDGEVFLSDSVILAKVKINTLVPNTTTLPPNETIMLSNNIANIQVELISEDKNTARIRVSNTP